MNKQRLKHLISVLKKVPKTKFNLQSWRGGAEDKPLGGCGTTACAVGWACEDPVFQAQGLSFGGVEPVFQTDSHELCGWDAVMEFFDIDHAIAMHLFLSDAYSIHSSTTKDVIARIETLLERYP